MLDCITQAILVGIGIFLIVISLQNSAILSPHLDVPFLWSSLYSFKARIVFTGLLIIFLLDHWRVPGGIMIGIMIMTLIVFMSGHGHFYGVTQSIPSIQPTLLKLQFSGLWTLHGVSVIFSLFLTP